MILKENIFKLLQNISAKNLLLLSCVLKIFSFFCFQAFIVLSCLVAAVIADGPGGHAHAHAPHIVSGPQLIHAGPAPLLRVAPGPLLRPLPLVRGPAPLAFAPAPLAFAPAPIAVAAAPAPVLLREEPIIVPAPAYRPAPAYAEPEPIDPPAYEFGYGVQGDAYTGSAQCAHNENRNGYNTAGEYRVALRDGRTQIVSYRVDDVNSGYVADVRYEGVAIPYEAPKPAYAPAPAPAYAPAA